MSAYLRRTQSKLFLAIMLFLVAPSGHLLGVNLDSKAAAPLPMSLDAEVPVPEEVERSGPLRNHGLLPSNRRVQILDEVKQEPPIDVPKRVAEQVTTVLNNSHRISAAETKGLPASHVEAPVSTQAVLPVERFVRKVLIVVSVLSLAGIVFFATTQWKRQTMPSQASSELRLVSSLSLAPRCAVSLINAGGQSFLVARDATGIKEIVPVRDEFESYLRNDVDEGAELSTATPWLSK